MPNSSIGGEDVLRQQDIKENETLDHASGVSNNSGAEGVDPLMEAGWYTDTMASALRPEVTEQVAAQQTEEKTGFKKFFEKVKSFFARSKSKSDKSPVKSDSKLETAAVTSNDSESNIDGSRKKELKNTLDDIVEEAKVEYEETNDPITKDIIDLSAQLDEALGKDEFDWNEINLIIRKLSLTLSTKMIQNDHDVIMEELERMKDDITKVQGTYNTKWELALGITIGAISIAGGLVGMGSGIGGATGALTSATVKTVGAIASGMQGVSQGGQSFSKFVSNSNESKRALYQFFLEGDRTAKGSFDSSYSGNRQKLTQQMSQATSENDRNYQAFLAALR